MNSKEEILKRWIESRENLAVALSGGVDSSTLVAFASSFMPSDRLLAFTLRTPYVSGEETERARTVASRFGVDFVEITLDIPHAIFDNPPRRCYLCKKALFSEIIREAAQRGFKCIADGGNADDISDYRPGVQALRELGIYSPLAECGFTKADVRSVARAFSLENAEFPANACLLTRVKHGVHVDRTLLSNIDNAERYLRELGYSLVRLRTDGRTARIELEPSSVRSFAVRSDISTIIKKIKDFGFERVLLDLEGYLKGSMNEKA